MRQYEPSRVDAQYNWPILRSQRKHFVGSIDFEVKRGVGRPAGDGQMLYIHQGELDLNNVEALISPLLRRLPRELSEVKPQGSPWPVAVKDQVVKINCRQRWRILAIDGSDPARLQQEVNPGSISHPTSKARQGPAVGLRRFYHAATANDQAVLLTIA
ncbi:hypothetical protein MRQ36_27770 [Micromonospora sp. R77]|nr:hypothetical protein [Micromonospora sp. R77]MCI4066141.1 hypothetical protein [Micromonospora sp. R77]